MLLTVVICTYARDELLAITLRTLADQVADPRDYRTMVVDNAGSGATRQVAERYGAHYVHEPKLGHSHARNRGCKEATTPWVLYLDDDVKVPPQMIAQFLRRLSTADYAALGGTVRHWFATPPPKWVRKYFAGSMFPSPQPEFGPLAAEHYLIGCQFAVSKSAWAAVGGFSDNVGMHGHAVGRADEDEFQLRLRAAGYAVYYDPAIYIDHLVQPYKYTIRGLLQLAYASGRDGLGMRGNTPLSHWGFVKRLVAITGYSLPFNAARLLFKSGYYWQNAVVDTLTKYFFTWPQYRAGFR